MPVALAHKVYGLPCHRFNGESLRRSPGLRRMKRQSRSVMAFRYLSVDVTNGRENAAIRCIIGAVYQSLNGVQCCLVASVSCDADFYASVWD